MTPSSRIPRQLAAVASGLLASAVLAAPAPAQDARASGPLAEFLDATRGAEVWLEIRARHEDFRDAAFPERSRASTVRTAFGLRTASFRGLRFGAELENTTVVGSERFYDGLNDFTDRPLVLDPEGTTLNRVFASFEDASGVSLEVGRLRYTLHDGRFLGPDPWRQNDQVFDGAVLRGRALDLLDLEYAYFGAVNRPSGDDAPNGRSTMNTHVFDVTHRRGAALEASAFLVHIDLDETGEPAPKTLGVRVAGELDLAPRHLAHYRAELARQRGDDGTGRDINASRAALELGWEVVLGRAGRVTLRTGVERLGASSGAGDAPFITPLASANDFNGWIDRFVVTPDDGLVDRYVGASYTIDQVELTATWHDFAADRGGADYGSEWNVGLTWRPIPELELSGAVADYTARGFETDATSVAVWASFTP
ncbi:hypothetical protein Pla163_10020 [Planctomycetes bacterium Pla163]|uniref:Alginate export domain-containing protein n=1 Tax=Rohdeia mirabilis TaxID=2528008 RepID=A0A518CXE3_9BACT|nr:hypothetical protein Pla163_10020 [Planctomycetes bacterium Pla163]